MFTHLLNHATVAGTGAVTTAVLLDASTASTATHGIPIGWLGLATVALQLLNNLLIRNRTKKELQNGVSKQS